MVNMNSIVAVLFIAVAVQAKFSDVENLITKPGEQYKLYKQYTAGVKLTTGVEKDVFKGMNIAGGDVIDDADLNLFYWHEELKFAIPRLYRLLDGADSDKKIHESELKDDMAKPHIAIALIECTYLLSPGLRQSCFADQLLTYAALVLGNQDVIHFFESIDTKETEKDIITMEELKGIKLPEGKHGKNLDILFEELGGNDNEKITKAEFTEYVTQESINDDFRECRKTGLVDAKTGNVDFKIPCLQSELVEYANDDLTELDISVLFRAVDTNGNGKITSAEIAELDAKFTGDKAKKVMELLDMSATSPKGTTPEIDYGEFRTYMRSPTILVQLERQCTEKETLQIKEIECLVKEFSKLIDEEHDPIWLVVPDLDQTSAFESLDTENDGTIKESELQAFSKFSNVQAAKRFIAEADNDGGKTVCLEEFNEYVDIPHMVYGTADCLLVSRKKGKDRGTCYTNEIADIIDNFKFFEPKAWEDWFNYYDSVDDDVINKKDNIDGKLGKIGLSELFLNELGQGGDSVSLFEFKWYVKQQELADKYDGAITALTKDLDEPKIKKLNTFLLEWIEKYVTEYDIEQFFDRLDKKVDGRKDHELTETDFNAEVWKNVAPLIKKIDEVETESDDDKTVNFREFWLWLHSKHGAKKVKDVFKTECTEPKDSQNAELVCYEATFQDPAKFGFV